MSAFVVKPSTINQILRALKNHPNLWDMMEDGLNLLEISTLAELGKAIYALNIKAVKHRYKNVDKIPGYYPNGKLATYRYQEESCNDCQSFKSIGCWAYQCSEGEVPNTPLYKLMCKVQRELAVVIVCNLPEYEAATWD